MPKKTIGAVCMDERKDRYQKRMNEMWEEKKIDGNEQLKHT